jgi:hypothetical protein
VGEVREIAAVQADGHYGSWRMVRRLIWRARQEHAIKSRPVYQRPGNAAILNAG